MFKYKVMYKNNFIYTLFLALLAFCDTIPEHIYVYVNMIYNCGTQTTNQKYKFYYLAAILCGSNSNKVNIRYVMYLHI